MSQSTPIGRVVRKPGASAESLESVALIVGAAVFIVGSLVAGLLFWGRDVPISGFGSIGSIVAIGSLFVGAISFAVGRFVVSTADAEREAQLPHGLDVPGARLHWFDVVALSIAHGVLAGLVWLGAADLFERSFIGAVLYPLPAAVLAGAGLAVTAYAIFLSSVRITPMLLSVVLAVFLVTGILASMLSASDPEWWTENLSALGMNNDISSLAFNLTLIIAGAIVTIVARYATATLPGAPEQARRSRTFVRVCLILIGIFLACVGIFPVDEHFWVHNTVATGMALVFATIVIGLPKLLPTMPRVFMGLGYVYVLVIVVLGVFFATGYYNLTAVELVAAVLIFSWIIVFLRNAGAVQPVSVGAPGRHADDSTHAGERVTLEG